MKRKVFLFVAMLFASVALFAQNVSISGTVVDEAGEPLIGVSVIAQGTTIGIMTDENGKFTLSVPANSTIEFSSIGYVSQSFPLGNQRVFNVTLAEDRQMIEETVVVGYGTVKRTNFTGSVATYNVGESAVASVPRTNPLEMLRGLAPGLSMSQSGLAGASPTMNIRGQRSLNAAASNSPLIVLDGVIYQGRLNDIDPNSIDSMSVMKDATSLASYGSQAANGVIMITSKKGQIGKPMINF